MAINNSIFDLVNSSVPRSGRVTLQDYLANSSPLVSDIGQVLRDERTGHQSFVPEFTDDVAQVAMGDNPSTSAKEEPVYVKPATIAPSVPQVDKGTIAPVTDPNRVELRSTISKQAADTALKSFTPTQDPEMDNLRALQLKVQALTDVKQQTINSALMPMFKQAQDMAAKAQQAQELAGVVAGKKAKADYQMQADSLTNQLQLLQVQIKAKTEELGAHPELQTLDADIANLNSQLPFAAKALEDAMSMRRHKEMQLWDAQLGMGLIDPVTGQASVPGAAGAGQLNLPPATAKAINSADQLYNARYPDLPVSATELYKRFTPGGNATPGLDKASVGKTDPGAASMVDYVAKTGGTVPMLAKAVSLPPVMFTALGHDFVNSAKTPSGKQAATSFVQDLGAISSDPSIIKALEQDKTYKQLNTNVMGLTEVSKKTPTGQAAVKALEQYASAFISSQAEPLLYEKAAKHIGYSLREKQDKLVPIVLSQLPPGASRELQDAWSAATQVAATSNWDSFEKVAVDMASAVKQTNQNQFGVGGPFFDSPTAAAEVVAKVMEKVIQQVDIENEGVYNRAGLQLGPKILEAKVAAAKMGLFEMLSPTGIFMRTFGNPPLSVSDHNNLRLGSSLVKPDVNSIPWWAKENSGVTFTPTRSTGGEAIASNNPQDAIATFQLQQQAAKGKYQEAPGGDAKTVQQGIPDSELGKLLTGGLAKGIQAIQAAPNLSPQQKADAIQRLIQAVDVNSGKLPAYPGPGRTPVA